MKTRLAHLWEGLSATYWFVPSLMTLCAAAGAFLLVHADRTWLEDRSTQWAYSGGAQGARALLATVAGSIITVAGVVFSITIATLTQASSQFGPRLLRNFMRDTGNQIVLGTFVATFAYCLLVLRTIIENDDISFVPNLSVTVAVLLAAASIGVLIYFVHHVSESIQAPVLAAAVARDLDDAIDRLFPEQLGHESAEPPPPDIPPDFDDNAIAVLAPQSGYLQAIDEEGLMRTAKQSDLLVRLEVRPGRFVMQDQPLLRAHPPQRVNNDVCESLAGAFLVGRHRTHEQDAEFSIHQLVEIAVRSLSPGINDPFTAINCIDWLGAALCRLAGRKMPSPYRFDDDQKLRVIAPGDDFGQMLDAAFNQIRQYARPSAAVTIRLLAVLARIAWCVRRADQQAAIRRHALLVHDADPDTFRQSPDRHDLDTRFSAVMQALDRRAEPDTPS